MSHGIALDPLIRACIPSDVVAEMLFEGLPSDLESELRLGSGSLGIVAGPYRVGIRRWFLARLTVDDDGVIRRGLALGVLGWSSQPTDTVRQLFRRLHVSILDVRDDVPFGGVW